MFCSIPHRSWRTLAILKDYRERRQVDKAQDLAHGIRMQTVSTTTACSMMDELLDEVACSHEPIQITSKRSVGVLLSERDWRAIQETLHLVSVPGMRDSILSGMKTPIDECDEELAW